MDHLLSMEYRIIEKQPCKNLGACEFNSKSS